MDTLLPANDPYLVVKEEISISETVIQEQRLVVALEDDTGDANLTPERGRTGGANQIIAQNDEAEVRKLATSFQCPKCLKRFGNRKLAKSHMIRIHSSAQRRLESCPICSRNFKYKSVLFVHMNNHREKVCPICNVVISGREALKFHAESLHIGKVEYVCPICFKMSIDSASHEDHVSSHNRRRRFECEDCSKYYASPEGLERHRQRHTGIIKNKLRINYECTICSRAHRSERNLRVHMKTHAGTRLFKCDQCPEKFLNRQYLQAHRKTHLSSPSKIIESKYKCSYCLKSYSHRQSLKTHIKTHTEARPYASPSDLARHRNEHHTEGNRLKCSICSKTLSSLRNLRSHMNIHTGMRPYQCDQCPNKYASSETLQIHRKSHNERNYKCSYCPKTYAEKYRLRNHINTHTGARPFKCDLCSKAYPSARNMARHRQSHSEGDKRNEHLTEDNQLKCSICSKALSSLRNLRSHMNIHTGKRPYQCDQCPNKYPSLSSLAFHLKSHKDRNYKCSYCPKTYVEKYRLRIHINIHSGARPFKCDLCSKAYPSARNLARHRQSHSEGDKLEYKCDICSDIFTNQRSLTTHSNRYHDASFKCHQCGRGYSARKYLYRHYRHNPSHDNSSELKCSICCKGFFCKRSLNSHMKTHLETLRPYKCNQCPKDYATRCGLKKHLRKHLVKPGECESLQDEDEIGERDKVTDIQTALVKYKCKECDKEFISERNLSFHSRQHEKELTP